jgi:co-chaperonin GroES (HSP10)
LPTSATSSPLPEAIVIAVGPGAPNKDGKVITPEVKAGDRVLLPGWGGNSIKVGEDVCVLSETKMIACYLRLLPFRNTTSSKIRTFLQR